MFEHAELKIDRAEKHINELHAEIQRFIDENRHRVTVKFDSNQGCDVLYLSAPNEHLPPTLAPIIGDAIHNMRSALDYIWYEFVCMFSAPDPYIKFPIRTTKAEVATAIHGRKVPKAFKPVVDFILDSVQPYEGGDKGLWVLHDLDITDKHEFLIPSYKIMYVYGLRAEDENGSPITVPEPRSVVPGFAPSIFRFIGKRNVKVTDDGNLSVAILFSQGPFEGKPVEKLLAHYLKTMRNVLEGFRAAVP